MATRVPTLVFVLAALALPCIASAEPDPAAAAMPFWAGEQLDYEVLVMGARAGTGNLKVSERRDFEGQDVLPVVAVLKSDGVFENVYPAHDRMMSLLRTDGAPTPVRSQLVGTRRDRSKKYDMVFDPRTGALRGDRIDTKDGKTRKRPLSTKVPAGTQDMVSWIYYLRTLDLAPGKKATFKGHSGNFLYTVALEVKRTEDVWTPLGFMESNVVDIVITRDGNKKFRKEATVWIGTDERRLPVKAAFHLKLLGDIEARLARIARPPATQTASL